MLGLYIHIPFCISKCSYCDFNSYKLDTNKKKEYISSLKKEMMMYKDYSKDKKISSIFLGGGTPSILESDEIKGIFKDIYENFEIEKDAEITMECNPGTLNIEKLKTIKGCGVNRLSIGLQAVQDTHLKFIGRIHTYEEFLKNYNDARKVGFDNISVDLMYCLPNHNMDEWVESLEKIVGLNPEHISAYSLILEEGTKLYNQYEKGLFEIIDEDTDIQMYNHTIDYLKSKGYEQYEISNYAKKGYESKHNILYWKCKEYIGIGAGASGYIENDRYNNVCNLKEYTNIINMNKKPIEENNILSTKDKIEEKIFMGLRMNEGIKYSDFIKEFDINIKDKYLKVINALLSKELIKESKDGFYLTQKGREISNSIFIEFID